MHYALYVNKEDSSYDVVFNNEDVVISGLKDKEVGESVVCLFNNNLIDFSIEGEMIIVLPIEGLETSITNDYPTIVTATKLEQEVLDADVLN